MFGLTDQDDDVIKIEVHRGERWTLERGRMQKAFGQAGWESPKATEFLFCGFTQKTLHAESSVDGRPHAGNPQARRTHGGERQVHA